MADTFGMSEGLVQRAIANLKKRRQNLLDGMKVKSESEVTSVVSNP